jgi:hypothetical protein
MRLEISLFTLLGNTCGQNTGTTYRESISYMECRVSSTDSLLEYSVSLHMKSHDLNLVFTLLKEDSYTRLQGDTSSPKMYSWNV